MRSGSDISAGKYKQLLHTIDLLYDAVCDLDKWPAFLAAAAELLDARGAQIGHHDLKCQSLSFSRLHGYEWSADHYLKYDELMAEDPRLDYFMSNPFRPVHCRMGIAEETLHRSRVYQEVLRPGGVEYSLGVSLNEGSQSLSYLLVLRDLTQPAFDEDNCRLLGELIPHLRRAMQLQHDIAGLNRQKDLSAKALDSMAVGILMLDVDAQIRFANNTARHMLQDGDGLQENEGRLEMTVGSNAGLRKRVRRLMSLSSTGSHPPGEVLEIARSSGNAPYNAVISPFRGDQLRAGWPSVQEPQVFVVVRDPDLSRETRQEILGRLYGLTPSQAGLASMLCDGVSVRDAAEMRGITKASARQYLKIVFQKMGVSRQGEMISTILNL